MTDISLSYRFLALARYYVLPIAIGGLIVRLFLSYWRLRQFPGPFLGRFWKLWIVRSIAKRSLYWDLDNVCKEYGPVVCIGGNQLVTNDPEILFRVNGARSEYRRSDWYKAARLDPKHENVASMMDEKEHMARRSKMAAGYSGKENLHLEESIDTHILGFVKLIETKYLSDSSHARPLDFAAKAQFLTLDVITDVAFGEPFGDLAADEDVHEYIHTIEKMLPVAIWVTVFPSLIDLIAVSWIGKRVLPSSGDNIGLGKAMGMAKRLVAERYGPNKKIREDMMGSFVRHGLTQAEAESESLIQMYCVAGAETTATAIRTTFLYIITQPKAYATLQSEIDDAVRENRISNPVRDAEARRLPYLLACIKEGLRIHPPAPQLLSKEVPPSGDVLDGKFVPAGTYVGICARGVQRNKSIFGEDVEVYRPERWIEASGERLQRMEKTADLVFGHGRYHCLGSNVAMIEIRKVFTEVRFYRPLDVTQTH